jgi:WD40 repeat protein
LASGSGRYEHDGFVRVWNAFTGEELAVLRGHKDRVVVVAFSNDGTRLASASTDRTVRIWATSGGEELAVLRGHEDAVRFVGFSPDGTRLMSASRDGAVRFWDTVPYRARYQERQAILAAKPQAKRIVDALWQELNDPKVVAERLRKDASLSKPVRRAAVNLVLQRAANSGAGDGIPE